MCLLVYWRDCIVVGLGEMGVGDGIWSQQGKGRRRRSDGWWLRAVDTAM